MREVLAGDLDLVSLPSVLQLIELESHDGTLELASGRLDFVAGQLVRASFLGLDGVDAAVEAVVRARGRFTLYSTVDELGGTPMSVQGVVLEACRVLDEIQRLGGQVPIHSDGALGAPLDALMVHADGDRTVLETIAASGLAVVAVVDALVAAVDAGRITLEEPEDHAELTIIEVRPPAAPVVVEAERVLEPELDDADVEEDTDTGEMPDMVTDDHSVSEAFTRWLASIGGLPFGNADPDPDEERECRFEDLIFDARRFVRTRRYAAAEEALRSALELRPESRIARHNLKRVLALQAAASAAVEQAS